MFTSTLTILIIVLLGFFSRYLNIFENNSEKVFSSYLYYFALPCLFINNLGNTVFDEKSIKIMVFSFLPLLLFVFIYLFIFWVFSLKIETLTLLILCTSFGSVVFFGIPYVSFVFNSREAEEIAVLSAVPISVFGWFVCITTLEFYSLRSKTILTTTFGVAKNVFRNPLILSMLVGILISIFKFKLPFVIENALIIVKKSTSGIAMFLLGMFFYGRSYSKFANALKFTFLRFVLLPCVAYFLYSSFFEEGLAFSILVLMHGMPSAINLIVLSERYDFQADFFPAYLLFSTFASILSLPVIIEFLR